ncbi:agmatinase [Gemmatimonadota bacterium]
MNFLDLPPELSDPEESGVMILPIPLDLTVSWKSGTAGGPAAILEASSHIEYYDEEIQGNPATLIGGITTHAIPELPGEPAVAMDAIEALASGLLRRERTLISLGGEHSITYPLVKAHQREWPDLSVLQIDAHADLRDTYNGSRFNHACPMRRIMEEGVHVTAVGIRSVDESEAPLLDGVLRTTFLAHERVGSMEERTAAIISAIPGDDVYLTIDLDGLDSSLVPAVGTPVPGGLEWYETLSLLRALCMEKRVVGADVVELCPGEGMHASDSVAARLVFKLVAYLGLNRGGTGL